MKHFKLLGLAMGAIALLTFAGSASATILTSPTGTVYTGTITAEAGTTELHPGSGTSFLTIKCSKSHVEGTVEQHGEGVTVKGNVAKLSFSECGNDVVTVLKAGLLEIHDRTGGNNFDGTLTSSGAEIRIHTSEGPVCTFKTSATDIGELTSSIATGSNATLDIGSASIPASGFLCPSTGVWTGDYAITSPSYLLVEGTNWH